MNYQFYLALVLVFACPLHAPAALFLAPPGATEAVAAAQAVPAGTLELYAWLRECREVRDNQNFWRMYRLMAALVSRSAQPLAETGRVPLGFLKGSDSVAFVAQFLRNYSWEELRMIARAAHVDGDSYYEHAMATLNIAAIWFRDNPADRTPVAGNLSRAEYSLRLLINSLSIAEQRKLTAIITAVRTDSPAPLIRHWKNERAASSLTRSDLEDFVARYTHKRALALFAQAQKSKAQMHVIHTYHALIEDINRALNALATQRMLLAAPVDTRPLAGAL